LRKQFWWMRRPCGWRVNIPHSPATVQITLSSVELCLSVHEVEFFHVLWNKTLLQPLHASKKCLYIIKNKIACFWSFCGYFIFPLLAIRYILGPRYAFHVEGGCWCLRWFYQYPLNTNIKTILYILTHKQTLPNTCNNNTTYFYVHYTSDSFTMHGSQYSLLYTVRCLKCITYILWLYVFNKDKLTWKKKQF
jgi:hypothetical protein